MHRPQGNKLEKPLAWPQLGNRPAGGGLGWGSRGGGAQRRVSQEGTVQRS